MKTLTLTWNAAVDAALIPTDLDRVLGAPERIGADGKLADSGRIRERAAHAYIAAHEGEQAVVQYADPAHADDRSRLVYRSTGTLTGAFVRYPVFGDRGCGTAHGFLLDGDVIPLDGLVSIEAEGDRATVTL